MDFFGTLAELANDTPRTWQMLFRLGFRSSPELEYAFSPESFNGSRTPMGSDYEPWLRSLFAAHARAAGVPATQLPSVVELLARNDRQWTVRATEGAAAFISKLLQDGHEVVLCSNWDYSLTPYLRQAALPDLPAVCSCDVGARKPDPTIVERALQLAGGRAEEACFVGDDPVCDMLAAIRAGVKPVWFRGRHEHDLVSSGLVSVLPSFEPWAR